MASSSASPLILPLPLCCCFSSTSISSSQDLLRLHFRPLVDATTSSGSGGVTYSVNSTHCYHNHKRTHFKSPLTRRPTWVANSHKVLQCRGTPQNNPFKSTAEKVAVFIVAGSLLLFGRLSCCKPALALLTTEQTTSSPATMEEMGDTQDGKVDDDDQEGMYLKILENNPRDVEALKVLLYGKMRKGKTEQVIKYVEKLMEVEPDQVEWRLLLALSYEMMGDLTRAKGLFMGVLEENPLLIRALHGLALVMHKNHEDPFEVLNKALEVAQSEKRVTEERNIQILIAQMYVMKGDLEKGLQQFEDLINENHRDFRPYLCQGIIYSLLGKTKEAEEQFDTYRSLVPNEFPQKGFIDDVMLAAKTESHEKLKKEFEAEHPYRR